MKMKIFSIKDVVSGCFGNLVLQSNKELAIRTFKNICSSSEVKNDLQLYCIGEFNIETGEIALNIEFLMSGSEVGGENA